MAVAPSNLLHLTSEVTAFAQARLRAYRQKIIVKRVCSGG